MDSLDQELVASAEDGDIDAVEQLIAEGANVNYVNADDGSTALMVAAEVGHASIVRLLIHSNSDANRSGDIGSEAGWSPLMAASINDHAEIVSTLLEDGGADVDQVDGKGITALAWVRNTFSIVSLSQVFFCSRKFCSKQPLFARLRLVLLCSPPFSNSR